MSLFTHFFGRRIKSQPIITKKKSRKLSLEVEVLESREVPTTGLVAAYNFNLGSGTVLTDVSGDSNNGSLTNAVWSTTAHSGDSHSLYFNGTNAYVNVANSTSLTLTSGMTLEAWVDPTSLTDVWQDILCKSGSYYLRPRLPTPTRHAWWTTRPVFSVRHFGPTPGPTWPPPSTAQTLPSSTKTARWRGHSYGQRQSPDVHQCQFQLGGTSAGNDFKGYLDDLRVYNTALTATQIQTDMKTPVVPALVVGAGASRSGNEDSVISFKGTASGGQGTLHVLLELWRRQHGHRNADSQPYLRALRHL